MDHPILTFCSILLLCKPNIFNEQYIIHIWSRVCVGGCAYYAYFVWECVGGCS